MKKMPLDRGTPVPPKNEGRGLKVRDQDRDVAALAKALANPARVKILRHLGKSAASTCGELVEELGLAQATVSQHLKVLKATGLVRGIASGPSTCYSLERSSLLPLHAWMGALAAEPAGQKLRVLFLCTGNSCRSQMAEGWVRALRADRIDPCSAGLVAHGQNARAIQVMAEAGVDISRQPSKTLASLGDQAFDVVVTVCGHADEHCPVFPGLTRKIHRGFDDPPKLAQGAKSDEEALRHYRRVRDQIKAFVLTLPEGLN
jgi:arsenate reductase